MAANPPAPASNSRLTFGSSGPFRSSRIRAPSLVPSSRLNNNAAAAHAAIQQTLVVDAARTLGIQGVTTGENEDGKNIRRRETIFGPDVGEDDEPGWTKPDEGAKVSVDVVKSWVERAKGEEGLHATTTLQALANLKRPTLLLQQLDPVRTSMSSERIEEDQISAAATPEPNQRRSSVPNGTAPLHQLKFNYDATAPSVNVTLMVYPTPVPVPEGKESISLQEEPTVLYHGQHPGGFNQLFTLPASHALDLSPAIAPPTAQLSEQEVQAIDEGNDSKDADLSLVRDSSIDTNRSSVERQMGNLRMGASTQTELATVPEMSTGEDADERRPSRLFGIIPRRRRESDIEANIEMTDQATEEKKEDEEAVKEPENGMRLLIKIDALGEDNQALKRRNSQLTHILITGMWVPEAGSTAPPGQNGKRVWVVKVVRREAVIGAHTFLLKEIYGLSSSSATKDAPAATTYPPTAGQDDPYASTPNECIVCLTSPRDVVLLPCRHLVVCRDCAVGMVEFGAGGKVARRDDNVETGEAATGDAAAGANGAAATPAAPAAPPVSGGTTATNRERRKKKPKGWYCPVCRQPYTSLLRLALPSSSKTEVSTPVRAMSQRAPSIRSVHTTHSLRRVSSITPTLPDGAEAMLENLRPAAARAEDPNEEGDAEGEDVVHRPQFVLGPEADVEDKKVEAEHREMAEAQPSGQTEGRKSTEGRGWKEV